MYSQASRNYYLEYLHVLKSLLFMSIIIKQKGVMQTNRLADTFKRHSFVKLLRLDVCKPTRLHHFFLF